MTSLRRTLLAGAAGMVFAVGTVAAANAAPVFTVNPNAIMGSGPTAIQATDINGNSSALITALTGSGGLGSTQAEQGVIAFNNLSYGTTPVEFMGPGSGNYALVVTFNALSTTTIGFVGSSNNQNQLTSLNFTMSADVLGNDTINAATSTGTPASLNNASEDVVLATGSLISGVASFNSTGGPALNALATFNVCTGAGTATLGGTPVSDSSCVTGLGTSYFVAPNPFFSLAFSESNTTASHLFPGAGFPSTNSGPTYAAITQDTTGLNFAVPEPSSLLLLGSGIVGLGLLRRRRRKNVNSGAGLA